MMEPNSTDTSTSLELNDINSLIYKLELNKLDDGHLVNLPSTDSTAQSICVTLDNDEHTVIFCNDSDNDSFDDEAEEEEEDVMSYSETIKIPLIPTSSTYGFMSCPICLESSVLQSSSCCKFRCCNTCWRAHISSAINDGRIKISCASSECNKYLTRDIIVHFIRYDLILHERYLKLYANINQNPRAKTCPRCSHLYSLDTNKPIVLKNSKKSNKKIPKQVQCSECLLVWCFRCSAPWHENLTCKQFIKGDRLLLKWINQKNEDQWNARKCPKCSTVIQRAGGCPHMTCSSCSCEFCYLCGRRYIKIPIIGQHNNKFSMLGCPYNLHPEKPWLRRTIRGVIATGVIVASPLIAVGALTAAVTVLPSVGIYKFVRHVRNRRSAARYATFIPREQLLAELDPERQHELFGFGLYTGDERILNVEDVDQTDSTQTTDQDFPLAIFAEMDIENLIIDEEKLPTAFQTCPTTPAIDIKNDHSPNLNANKQ